MFTQKSTITKYDLIYEEGPSCWQDGFLMGNGRTGAVYFFSGRNMSWLVNKTDVVDARVNEVKKIIPFDEARKMVREGALERDFHRAETGSQMPVSAGPKSCFQLALEFGSVQIPPNPPIVNSRLSLYDATTYIEADMHLFHPRISSFVDYDSGVFLMRVQDVSPFRCYCNKLYFSRPEDIDLDSPEISLRQNRFVMKMDLPEMGSYVAVLEIRPRQGNAMREKVKEFFRPEYHNAFNGTGKVSLELKGRYGIALVEGDFDLAAAVVSSREASDPEREAHRILDSAFERGYEKVHSSHSEHWSKFWTKPYLDLGNEKLEALYYNSLYILGSTYSKAPTPGLLGLMYGPGSGPVQYTPWYGNLTTDLNVQCPFMGVFAAGHPGLADAYMDTWISFLPEARRLAKEIFNCDGAHFPISMDVLGHTQQGGVGAHRFYYAGSYIGLIFCLVWKYRRDIVILKEKIYPFLKEIILFYQQIFTKGDDGILHLWPAHAPELYVMDCADPVQVISMLKVCLCTAIEAAELLDEDSDLKEQWVDMLSLLPSYPCGTDWESRLVVVDGKGIPADHHVGQAGCLHPVYPCGEVDEFSDRKDFELFERTFQSVMEKSAETNYADAEGKFHFNRIWQCFFRALTALRLGHGKQFREVFLPMFIDCFGKPNRNFSHDEALVMPFGVTEDNLATIPPGSLEDVGTRMPRTEPWCGGGQPPTPNPKAKEVSIPVIEGSGDFVSMINESLMMSHNGVIRVFPGWNDGNWDMEFRNLMAEGSLAVDSRMKKGLVEFIKIRKLKTAENLPAEKVKVKLPWNGKVCEYEIPENEDLVLKNPAS